MSENGSVKSTPVMSRAVNAGSTSPLLSRRTVIAGAAAVAGAAGMAGLLPKSLLAAASADPVPFSLDQIKHVVYVMQENRSFDHYFGTYPGARGFDDPTAITLPNGNSVFQQPDPANPDGYLEPFHMDTATTGAAAVPSLSHDWRDQHASWNKGAMDGWLHTHLASDGDAKGSFTMGYMEKQDIPFHWALAENFTLLDNYHCSVMGPTYPNRAIWMSGTNDPQGRNGGPILETVGPNTLTWTSAAEVLYNAGYSVKTYTSSGSYNYFSWWANFKTAPTATTPNTANGGYVDQTLYNWIMGEGTLFGDGTPGGVGNPAKPTKATTGYFAFEEDCANGTLADVTWLFPDGPYASDEHPPNTPAAGAFFLASKLEALAANPDLWNSTVFIINYDENDGFFDHVPPPTPDPTNPDHADEFVSLASPKGTPGGGLPVGAGFRVPCFVISPWTVGGHIYSAVSDHTSPLRLIEAITAQGGLNGGTPTKGMSAKAPVTFSAISTWRRATFDDFTGVFGPTPQAAPTDAEFAPDVRQANYTAQLTASSLPMPARPGAAQSRPHQNPVSTSTALSASKASQTYGATSVVTLTATVSGSGGTPSGSVTFYAGSTKLGTASLSGGKATYALSRTLGVGAHAITASYAGATGWAASTSAAVTVTVVKAPTTTTLKVADASLAHGQRPKVTVTVTATGVTPTGTVTIYDGTRKIGTGKLSAGKVTVTLVPLAKGTHTLKATYPGTSATASSTSVGVKVTSK